uniref:Uncharacterized protein n=1 Tax=Arundo donax TaxID=35708 RepID=A0A0A9F1R7_ARUDO
MPSTHSWGLGLPFWSGRRCIPARHSSASPPTNQKKQLKKPHRQDITLQVVASQQTLHIQRMPERGGWDLADLAPPAWSPRARRIRLGAAPLGSAPSELPRASRGPGGERGGRGASPQRSRVRAGGAGRGA